MTDRIYEITVNTFAFIVLLSGLLVLFIGFPVYLYSLYQTAQAPTFTLNMSEWACTASHPVSTTTYVRIENVMTPVTSSSTQCDQWSAAK